MEYTDDQLIRWIRAICAVELKADPGFPFFWASYKDHETPNEALLRMFKENLRYADGDIIGSILVMCHG